MPAQRPVDTSHQRPASQTHEDSDICDGPLIEQIRVPFMPQGPVTTTATLIPPQPLACGMLWRINGRVRLWHGAADPPVKASPDTTIKVTAASPRRLTPDSLSRLRTAGGTCRRRGVPGKMICGTVLSWRGRGKGAVEAGMQALRAYSIGPASKHDFQQQVPK